MMQQVHEISFRVYAEDTDMMGIMYHANYFRFYERARTEMLRASGLSLTHMAAHNTQFAIREATITFLHPARLEDLLIIKTSCKKVRATSLAFYQEMWHISSQKKLSDVQIHVVCVGSDLKPKRLPAEF